MPLRWEERAAEPRFSLRFSTRLLEPQNEDSNLQTNVGPRRTDAVDTETGCVCQFELTLQGITGKFQVIMDALVQGQRRIP